MIAKLQPALNWCARMLAHGLWIVMVLFGIFVLYQSARFGDGLGVISIVLAVLSVGPAILVHELGHAIAAWLAGFRVFIIAVVPFSLRLSPLSLGKSSHPHHDAGGFMFAVPKTEAHNTAFRSMMLTLAGPLVSLGSGAALLLLLYGMGPSQEWASHVLFAQALMSFACAAVTAIPFTTKQGRPNDAASVIAKSRRYVSNAFSWRRGLEVMDIETAAWPNWILERTTALDCAIAADVLIAIERENYEEARERAAALATAPEGAHYFAVTALVAALHDGTPEIADAMLAKIIAFHEVRAEFLMLRQLTLALILAREDDPDGPAIQMQGAERTRALLGPGAARWTPLFTKVRQAARLASAEQADTQPA